MLEDKLSGTGFKKNLSRQALSRKTETGRQHIHLSLVSRISHVDVYVDLALRHDALDELVYENTVGWIDEKRKHETNTVGVDLGKLVGPLLPKPWSVDEKTDIDSVAESITFDLMLFGLPYLEKYSDLEQIFSSLRRGGRDADLLNIVPLSKALNLVGLAFLLRRFEIFDDLIEQEGNWLNSIPNSGQQVFLDFATALKRKGWD